MYLLRDSLPGRIERPPEVKVSYLTKSLIYNHVKRAGLYDPNRAVYDLLRYGVKVRAEVERIHSDRLPDRLERPA